MARAFPVVYCSDVAAAAQFWELSGQSVSSSRAKEQVVLVSRLTYTLDCCDAEMLAAFWTEALGYSSLGTFGTFTPLASPESDDEPWFVLQQVGEPKSGKNRMHLDIHVTDLDAEVRRLRALGASQISDTAVVMGDFSWFVMSDPEGNEFCIVRRPES